MIELITDISKTRWHYILVPVHRNRGILTSLLTQNLDDGRVLFSKLFIIIIIYYSYYLLLTIIYLLLIMYYLKNEQECFIRFKATSAHERAARVALDLIKHDLRVF
jgi:hypothetical protein